MKPIVLTRKSSEKGFTYRKLYNEIVSQIKEGSIKNGEKLPSLRKMAEDLGISLTSVSKSYELLISGGYVDAVPNSGFYVISKPQEETTNYEFKYVLGDNMSEKNTKMTDRAGFDFVKWKKCISAVFNDYSDMLLYESDTQGEYALRKQIARYIQRSRGVITSPDSIIIGAGTQQITQHICRLLKKAGISLVSMEEPGYLPVQSVFNDNGFTIIRTPVCDDGINPDTLPLYVPSVAYVNPSNQFPTGAVMSVEKRAKLIEWAKNNGSYIIEDDYDSELRYVGKSVPSLKSMDTSDRVIYLSSFSSTLFPAIKISYMILPDEMMKNFGLMKKFYTQTCSKAEQLALALFIQGGYYSQTVKKLRKLNERKLKILVESLENEFGGRVKIKGRQSGISVTLLFDSDMDVDELVLKAECTGLNIVPVSSISDEYTKAMIIYINNIGENLIEEAVKKLKDVWSEEGI